MKSAALFGLVMSAGILVLFLTWVAVVTWIEYRWGWPWFGKRR